MALGHTLQTPWQVFFLSRAETRVWGVESRCSPGAAQQRWSCCLRPTVGLFEPPDTSSWRKREHLCQVCCHLQALCWSPLSSIQRWLSLPTVSIRRDMLALQSMLG